MGKFILIFLELLCIFNLNAENPLNGKSNPNYKNLKVYAKVLERCEKSDFYIAKIDIENTGDSAVSFRETTYDYAWIFNFTAYGVFFINEYQRLYYEKKIDHIPELSAVDREVVIFPHTKYTIETMFYIFNRKRFLQTNKNLRLEFHYNDANLGFMVDRMNPTITSQDTIDYKW